jgi:hypothetical protein
MRIQVAFEMIIILYSGCARRILSWKNSPTLMTPAILRHTRCQSCECFTTYLLVWQLNRLASQDSWSCDIKLISILSVFGVQLRTTSWLGVLKYAIVFLFFGSSFSTAFGNMTRCTLALQRPSVIASRVKPTFTCTNQSLPMLLELWRAVPRWY